LSIVQVPLDGMQKL
jgi:hypothetical protein